MNTVLMVDDEQPLLLSLKDGLLASNDRLDILLANNGREAVDIMQEKQVDLLITDLKMPVMDGFELLAHVSRTAPYTPIIVMTAFGTPDIEEQLSGFNALHYLEKPLDFDTLANTVESALNTDSNSFIRGISLATFLQLLHMEKKNCSLTVRAHEQSGQLHIRNGELIDASTADKKGKDAALEIIAWRNTEIEMDGMCRADTPVINEPISYILMEAHRILDEESGHGNVAKPSSAAAAGEEPADDLLVRTLHGLQMVSEFALFGDGGKLVHLSPSASHLERLDPACYLAACQPLAESPGCERLSFLLFTTSGNSRYMILSRSGRRIILLLTGDARPGDIVRSIDTAMERKHNNSRTRNATAY